MSSIAARITLSEALTRIQATAIGTFSIPLTTNKGNVGLWLEKHIGIPNSSECLDCLDGEIKAFPLKELSKSKQRTAKESIAVTMVEPAKMAAVEPFEESRVFKKLSNTLFVPYHRVGDMVTFYQPTLFDKSDPLMAELKVDYETIQEKYIAGEISGRIGKLLQTRTKGAGHGSTSRAFYLRPVFINQRILGL